MNKLENVETITLSQEDRETLQIIYNTRRRFLFSAIGSIGLFVAYYFKYIIIKAFITNQFEIHIIFVICALLFFLMVGVILFIKTIYPFKKDLDFGKKLIVVYSITNKIYIPTTDEYFFSINDLDVLNYEVDQKLYNAKEIGDEVKVARGFYSKYVFENNRTFQLL